MEKQKIFLKYVSASFIPVIIYALVLLALPANPSFAFTTLSMIAMGLIGQVAFNRYIERNK